MFAVHVRSSCTLLDRLRHNKWTSADKKLPDRPSWHGTAYCRADRQLLKRLAGQDEMRLWAGGTGTTFMPGRVTYRLMGLQTVTPAHKRGAASAGSISGGITCARAALARIRSAKPPFWPPMIVGTPFGHTFCKQTRNATGKQLLRCAAKHSWADKAVASG